MRLRPALLMVLILPALFGCNEVYTRRPLVSEAREQGDPEFRPGLWSAAGYNDDCVFDIRKNRRDWPACAVGIEVRRGEMYLVTGHDKMLFQTYRLIDGQPLILQSHLSTDVFKDARVPEPKDTDNPIYGWTYAAITVLNNDAADRIIEAQRVQAQCGPVPPKTAAVTSSPFAGLTVVGSDCVAKDLDAVKTALAGSAGLGPPQPMKWIRDQP